MDKIHRYWDEIRQCCTLGADSVNAFRLAESTLQFHAANALRARRHERFLRPRKYFVRLGERSIPIWLRTAGDFFVLHEVFLSKVYSLPRGFELGASPTIVDLGAHVGLTTLYFSEIAPQARFICVEPHPTNRRLLSKNVKNSNVQIIDAAVGNPSSDAWLLDPGPGWGTALGSRKDSAVAVRVIDMNQVLRLGGNPDRIDLLKVDIEGAEEFLFASPKEWISRVRLILIELHPNYSPGRFAADVAPFGFKVSPPGSELGNRIFMAAREDLCAA